MNKNAYYGKYYGKYYGLYGREQLEKEQLEKEN